MSKRQVPEYWWKTNGVPMPVKDVSKAKAIDIVNKCQKMKSSDEMIAYIAKV